MKVDRLQNVQASLGHLPDFQCTLQAWLYDCTTASIRSFREQLNLLQQRAYASGLTTVRCWKQCAVLLQPDNHQTVNTLSITVESCHSLHNQIIQFFPICTPASAKHRSTHLHL